MGRKKKKKRSASTPSTEEKRSHSKSTDICESGNHNASICVDTNSCFQLQKEEIEVLEAIYGEEFQHRKSANPIGDQIAFSVRVKPNSSENEDEAEVTLVVEFNQCYPLLQPPSISLENICGLSDDEIRVLRKKIMKDAELKVGEVMIHDILVETQEYVANHTKQNTSFFEEMMHRNEEIERKIEEEYIEQIKREEEEAIAEEKALHEIIQEELTRKEEKIRAIYEKKKRGDLEEYEEHNEKESHEAEEDDSSSEDEAESYEHSSSRYHHDFKELGLLGRGGGGQVVKVRNRLDRQLYAVKSIKLNPEDRETKKKILREVKTISRLQHRYIVRYFQAWLEGGDGDSSEEEDEELDWLDRGSEDEDDWFGNSSVSRCPSTRHSTGRRISPNASSDDNSSEEDADAEWAAMEEAPMEMYNTEGWEWTVDTEYAGKRDLKMSESNIKEKKLHEKLYIQMEYCEARTLREVIDTKELCKNRDKMWRLFRQVLEAIVYIHAQGVIHRDIKPPNIFLDSEGCVKLGDFGLATQKKEIMDEDSEGSETSDLSHNIDSFSLLPASENERIYGQPEPNPSKTKNSSVEEDLTIQNLKFEGADDSITAGVGTAFYRAPEQEKEGSRYSQKADMFSLGILFFEMASPPFTTLMERAEALIELRERNNILPQFSELLPEKVKEIVHWLCNTNPSARPTSSELLSSNLLPPKMEVEETYLKEALQTLTNPQGSCFNQLLEALFIQDPMEHVDYTFDLSSSARRRMSNYELRCRTQVRRIIQNVFEKHGGVEQFTPLLCPLPPKRMYGNVSTQLNAYTLLDKSGVTVNLPYNLTEPFARFIARNGISQLKRYHFSRVFRKTMGGGHPRELCEADFDIIWDNRATFRVIELEVILVVAEVMKALSPYLGFYYFRLGNSKLAKAIMDLCEIPQNARRKVLNLLSLEASNQVHSGVCSKAIPSFKPFRWKQLYKKLKEESISPKSIENLKPFFLLPEDCLTALYTLETIIEKLSQSVLLLNTSDEHIIERSKREQRREIHLCKAMKEAKEGISSLRQLIQGMEFLQFSSPICIRIDLGLNPRQDQFSNGLVFQALLYNSLETASHHHRRDYHSDIIAEGGRYDNLVSRYRLPAARIQAPVVGAMGVRFAMDKIITTVLSSILSKDIKFPVHSIVLVCSAGKSNETLSQRIRISKMLREANISTDFLHPDAMHLEDLEEYCFVNGIKWMIIVRRHMLTEKGSVKVRVVKTPTIPDRVVNVQTLVDFFLENCLDSSNHQTTTLTASSSNVTETKNEGKQPHVGFDIRIIDSKHQQKDKQNKAKDLATMERRVGKWMDTLFTQQDGEATLVLSIDIPFSILREFGTVLMESGSSGIEELSTKYSKYRKTIKYALEVLKDITHEDHHVRREKYVLLYSSCDDRYDMISLASSIKI